jgi:hypothetical protein
MKSPSCRILAQSRKCNSAVFAGPLLDPTTAETQCLRSGYGYLHRKLIYAVAVGWPIREPVASNGVDSLMSIGSPVVDLT